LACLRSAASEGRRRRGTLPLPQLGRAQPGPPPCVFAALRFATPLRRAALTFERTSGITTPRSVHWRANVASTQARADAGEQLGAGGAAEALGFGLERRERASPRRALVGGQLDHLHRVRRHERARELGLEALVRGGEALDERRHGLPQPG